MSSSETRIGRVRLRGGGVDRTRAQLRLAALLARAELRPPGLPPAAVLCVRRLADPLPGTLRLEAVEARPPPEWERAFVTALERALRGAARPAREAVPASADAVLFADRAELLACLARDWREGTAWLRWWWHDLRLAPTAGRNPVAEAWLETPEHVPAALELLAARGEAAAFVALLAEGDAATLVLRVIEAHALPELRRAVGARLTAAPSVPTRAEVRPESVPQPPWRALAPESVERPLPRPAELLLGVALVLRRAPPMARSASFAAATRAWLAEPPPPTPSEGPAAGEQAARVAEDASAATAATQAPAAQPPAPTRPEPRVSVLGAALAPRAHREATAAAPAPERRKAASREAAEAAPLLPDEPPSGAGDAPAGPGRRAPAQRRASARPEPESAPAAARAEPAAAVRRTHRRQRMQLRPALPVARRAPVRQPVPSPELVVETQLGGVFYLLNLALFLELYGDFTRPLEPGLALSPWDLLALLAPRLLGEPIRDDPLWPLLAQLAGRDQRTRPGGGFRPPRVWRTPRAWLEPFGHEGEWRWSAARGMLRLVHPAGFAVAAVPRTPEPPRTQLARELRRLRRLAPSPLRAALPREPARPLARWCARLAGYADARLRLALGLERDAALAALLLRCRARVLVTPSHVDVEFRLDELPLEVRIAGLDRTPGWIPAAGRVVSFHFA